MIGPGMLKQMRFLGDSGVAALEFALIAPMLAFLMTGGFDFGRAIYEQHRLSSAARAGVQYAIQSSTTWTNSSSIIAAARADAGDASNSLTVTAGECTCPTGTSRCAATSACTGSTLAGTYVKVAVSESYTTLLHYPFVSSPLSLSGQAMIRVQ